MKTVVASAFVLLSLTGLGHLPGAPEAASNSGRDWPIVAQDNFETDPSDRWQPSDPAAWKWEETDRGKAYHQFKHIVTKTPVRSPFNRNVLKEMVVGDFQLDVDFQSTARDYPHRSLCLFFGYQDPAHMYYVHFGQRTDDHANQVFIVNDRDRVKISTKTTAGTPWDNEWHHARIIRTVGDGKIEVFFDDMTTPVMTAEDKTFIWGQIGIGSFDDTGRFRNLALRGERVERPTK